MNCCRHYLLHLAQMRRQIKIRTDGTIKSTPNMTPTLNYSGSIVSAYVEIRERIPMVPANAKITTEGISAPLRTKSINSECIYASGSRKVHGEIRLDDLPSLPSMITLPFDFRSGSIKLTCFWLMRLGLGALFFSLSLKSVGPFSMLAK